MKPRIIDVRSMCCQARVFLRQACGTELPICSQCYEPVEAETGYPLIRKFNPESGTENPVQTRELIRG